MYENSLPSFECGEKENAFPEPVRRMLEGDKDCRKFENLRSKETFLEDLSSKVPKTIDQIKLGKRKRKKSINSCSKIDVVQIGDSQDEEGSEGGTRLFEYPPGKDSVIVTVKDYMTLEHETWLNDIVIDFYLNFLFLEVLPPELRSSVHLFSSMFYKRMLGVGFKNKTTQREEAGMTSAQRKHSQVKMWTKNVNLFEKEFIIFPICEGNHWFLIVAILPRLATLAPGSAARRGGGEPLVLVLDSLNRPQTGAVADIRSYLALEWAARGGGGNHTFDTGVMKTLRPRKPEQQNGDDCGVYLLYYVEKMFTR